MSGETAPGTPEVPAGAVIGPDFRIREISCAETGGNR